MIQAQHATTCPFCAHPLSLSTGGADCPHCRRQVSGVPCPKCGRRTLNLALIKRYGKTSCFACQYELCDVPEPDTMLSQTLEKSSITVHPTPRRVPGLPQLPTAGETRQIMEEHLLGLERAMLDREVLRAPDLRVMASRYLDHIQDVLDLDTAIEQGEVTPLSLRKSENLDIVARLVFRPLWVDDGAWLPPQIHAWIFAIDDAARRWQYIRRRWLADHCRLTLIPVVPSVTTLNSAWHTIIGEGQVVSAQLSPGFLLDDEVLRKATVRAE